jgi:hypothetical protein
MLDFARYVGAVASALGFPPAEDNTQNRIRRFFALSTVLILGSSTVFIGAASFMKVKEAVGHAPGVSSFLEPLSKDVCHHRLLPLKLTIAQLTRWSYLHM